MRLEARWVFAVLLCALAGSAQEARNVGAPGDSVDKSSATGTVTGRVYLDDSKVPARKASVYLQPAADLQSDAPNDRNSRRANGAGIVGIETSFDGSFSFSHVAYGSYYVIAFYPGYISPYVAISLAEARAGDSAQGPLGTTEAKAKELVLKNIPRVSVQSDQPANTDVTLERGGAISGNISYDDGSPAIGLEVEVLARMLQEGKETWSTFNSFRDTRFGQILTDDRGSYRISDLPDQKYVVRVMLNASETTMYISSGSTSSTSTNNSSHLMIYSGNTPHLKNAIPIVVRPGEERTGEDLRIPMSKLHKITGFLVSAHDGHVINSGQVTLFSADDHAVAGYASSTQGDPGFTFNFVFDGDYILSSPASMDIDYPLQPQPPGSTGPPQYDAHPLHLYGSATTPLHVSSDMDGVTIAVPEPTAREAQDFQNALRQQGQQNHSSQ